MVPATDTYIDGYGESIVNTNRHTFSDGDEHRHEYGHRFGNGKPK